MMGVTNQMSTSDRSVLCMEGRIAKFPFSPQTQISDIHRDIEKLPRPGRATGSQDEYGSRHMMKRLLLGRRRTVVTYIDPEAKPCPAHLTARAPNRRWQSEQPTDSCNHHDSQGCHSYQPDSSSSSKSVIVPDIAPTHTGAQVLGRQGLKQPWTS